MNATEFNEAIKKISESGRSYNAIVALLTIIEDESQRRVEEMVMLETQLSAVRAVLGTLKSDSEKLKVIGQVVKEERGRRWK